MILGVGAGMNGMRRVGQYNECEPIRWKGNFKEEKTMNWRETKRKKKCRNGEKYQGNIAPSCSLADPESQRAVIRVIEKPQPRDPLGDFLSQPNLTTSCAHRRKIFEACGVVTNDQLDTLAREEGMWPDFRDLILGRGVTHLEWLVIKSGLNRRQTGEFDTN